VQLRGAFPAARGSVLEGAACSGFIAANNPSSRRETRYSWIGGREFLRNWNDMCSMPLGIPFWTATSTVRAFSRHDCYVQNRVRGSPLRKRVGNRRLQRDRAAAKAILAADPDYSRGTYSRSGGRRWRSTASGGRTIPKARAGMAACSPLSETSKESGQCSIRLSKGWAQCLRRGDGRCRRGNRKRGGNGTNCRLLQHRPVLPRVRRLAATTAGQESVSAGKSLACLCART
jgi:hypothetical protein